MAPSLGRGCWRLKTASCWRRARFSSIRQRRVRNRRSTAPSQSRNRPNMATKVIADRLCRLPCEVVDFTAGQDCDEGQKLWGNDDPLFPSTLVAPGTTRQFEVLG